MIVEMVIPILPTRELALTLVNRTTEKLKAESVEPRFLERNYTYFTFRHFCRKDVLLFFNLVGKLNKILLHQRCISFF